MKNVSKPGPRSRDETQDSNERRAIMADAVGIMATAYARGWARRPVAAQPAEGEQTMTTKERVIAGLKAGRKQFDIANECGVSQAYVSQILSRMQKEVEA
jgi:hypothetical protein